MAFWALFVQSRSIPHLQCISSASALFSPFLLCSPKLIVAVTRARIVGYRVRTVVSSVTAVAPARKDKLFIGELIINSIITSTFTSDHRRTMDYSSMVSYIWSNKSKASHSGGLELHNCLSCQSQQQHHSWSITYGGWNLLVPNFDNICKLLWLCVSRIK